MPSDSEKGLAEAAILTRAIENVFRKLIRFLIGRISLVKLQEMIRFIYVEESERKLKGDQPNKDVALTRLALLTGLDTRTLQKTRNSDGYRKPMYKESRFIKEMTPESCVLDVWISSPKFLDKKSGEPMTLPLDGEDVSFDSLVKEAVSSRGVTTQSLLASLIENNAVGLNKHRDTVELLQKIQAPFRAGNEWGALEVGLLHACSLLETVFHNYEAVRDGRNTFYQRGCWSNRLTIQNKRKCELELKELLKKTDKEARKIISLFEENTSKEDYFTAGLSFFYFEEGSAEQELA